MKIGFIGAGKMAEAILSDLIRSSFVKPQNVYMSDVNSDRRKLIRKRYCVNIFPDSRHVMDGTDVVLLAVKPQDIDSVLGDIADILSNKQLIISIVAGKKLSYLTGKLNSSKVIRVMPNIAALVSESMSAFCVGKGVGEKDKARAVKLLSSFGEILEVPEKHFDAVTALSGSGPAFFAHFLSLMIDAGTNLGLQKKDSAILACQTILGTATLLAKGIFTPDELVEAVSSPKGTTVAGLEVLQKAPVANIIRKTLQAAADRSKELNK
ncbi:MAG: pyrroline-5-carboxylate reductase [Kiritimatiellae bacterium]|nr:pyrroline-5-carboxylate reductase [Kiritimatiellia bacterium]